MALWNQATPESNSEKPVPPAPTPTPTAIPAAATSAPASAPTPKESSTAGRRESVFGPGVTIESKIEGDADIRIGGKFKGDLNLDKGAKVSAKVHAANVTIGGELEGNVAAGAQVKLLESGQLIGDLKAATLTVAAGSRMRGHVEFGWGAGEVAKFTNGHAHEPDKAGVAG